jgi:hypothetical protein
LTLEEIFVLANLAVLPAWFLLLVFPGGKRVQTLVHKAWIPILLGAAYAGLLSGTTTTGGGFDSLEAVMRLFDDPTVVLAGWIHYLVFDLFVGAWEVRDGQRRGLSRIWVAPCVLLTFSMGPLGLLAYLIVRGLAVGTLTLDES